MAVCLGHKFLNSARDQNHLMSLFKHRLWGRVQTDSGSLEGARQKASDSAGTAGLGTHFENH